MPRLIKDLLFLSFLAFIIVVIVAANRHGTSGVFSFLNRVPHFDKIGHFALMGILAFLALPVFVPRMTSSPAIATRKVLGIFLILIALEEASQAFNPNRSFSIPDYLFSVAGVVSAGLISRSISKKPEKN